MKVTVCWNMSPWSCFDYPENWGSNLFRTPDHKKKKQIIMASHFSFVAFRLFCALNVWLEGEGWGRGVERNLLHIFICLFYGLKFIKRIRYGRIPLTRIIWDGQSSGYAKKIRIIGFYFKNRLHWQLTVLLLLFTVCTCV